MALARRIQTNFSKGELSPLVEGRPDLAAYFEGGSTVENWLLLRQGGLTRRPGLRFIKEVKDSSKDTILIPFEASVNDAFILEYGNSYVRMYKNKNRLESGGNPFEIVSPYVEAQLRAIHYTQSVDVLFQFHGDVRQQRLSRVSDLNWTMSPILYSPSPSFENDTDIADGETLTPGATTGNNVIFAASDNVFLSADVGRMIIFGSARAIIKALGPSAGDAASPNDHVRADILDAFPNTDPITAGSWLLRLSPQTTLDPDKKEPVGTQVTLTAGAAAFRTADIGKFIAIYAGLVRITHVDSATSVRGTLLSVMTGTEDANPAAAPAGAWTLEEESWTAENGFPATGEFFQGRLGQARTRQQPTTFWLSASDSFDDYAVGLEADRAIDYTISSKRLNRIEWLADRDDLFIGTSGAELRATAGRSDEPFGGDVIPLVKRIDSNGSAGVQPAVISGKIIFLDRSRRKIFAIAYNIEEDGFNPVEITAVAEHITGSGVRPGALAVALRPDPRVYFVRDDGQLITLTYHKNEKVVGFTRIITDGFFESVAVIPHPSDSAGYHDEVWVIVRRTINGVTKRYVEMFEENDESITERSWTSFNTDSAVLYKGVATNVITNLGHLEGKEVAVVANGGMRGMFTVSGAQITLPEMVTEAEIGIPYTSILRTMRPAIEGTIIEGLPRSWARLYARMKDSMGGHIQGERLEYPPSPLNTLNLYTGDRDIVGHGWDTDGRVTLEQRDPYPMTVLAIFGKLQVGDD